MVTYWLAKLLDPHHEVVLSHEHQDFKVVGKFVKFVASSFGLKISQLKNQNCLKFDKNVILHFFNHFRVSLPVGGLRECLSACKGVP